jgi:predicted MFS family arabinose efflux permease/ADP-ribose pyrophosphatase YjhB (NUDIX family)
VGAPAVAHPLDGAAKAVAVTWRNTDLRRAQLSFGGAWTAEWSFTVGISIYAFRHGGVTAVGVVSLLRMLPAALAAPALTPYADRWRRDRVLASVSAVRAAATGAAAAIVATVDARLAVYALAVVASVAAVLFRPVHSALLPSLCRTPYELTSANVVRGILDAAATLLGPALATVFLVHGGVPAVFAAAAIASAVSAGLMLTLHPADVPRDREQTQVGARLADGLRVVVRNRDLGILIGLTALQTVMRGAVGVFVVVVAIDLLGTGEPGVGSLTAAIGAGAVLGSLVTTLLVGTHRLARWYGVGVALWGLPLALLAARPTQPVALLLLALVGVGNALVDIGLFTLIARRAPDAVLAAVFGVLESACALGVAAGSLLAPLMINLVGTRDALVAVGLLSPIAVLAAWRRLRALDITVEHQDHEIDVLRGVPRLPCCRSRRSNSWPVASNASRSLPEGLFSGRATPATATTSSSQAAPRWSATASLSRRSAQATRSGRSPCSDECPERRPCARQLTSSSWHCPASASSPSSRRSGPARPWRQIGSRDCFGGTPRNRRSDQVPLRSYARAVSGRRAVPPVATHAVLASLLTDRQPVSVEQTEWPGGLALEFALYLGPADLPDDLVTSARCLVTAGGQLLACEDAHPSVHVWPGGRREPHESWAQTARREVREETGWLVQPESLTMLGFLHYRHLTPVPPDHPYPSPDFLQVVMHGAAVGGPEGWVDTEAYVLRSWLTDFDDAASLPLSEAEQHAIRVVRELG